MSGVCRRLVLGLAILVALAAAAAADETEPVERLQRAERDCQRVMNAGLPFVERMLQRHGEFFPFAGVMLPDGLVRTLGAVDDGEQPSAEELLDSLLSALRQAADAGECIASAIFVMVHVRHPQTDEVVQAVQAGLEHRDGYCVDVFFPVVVSGDSLELAEPFAVVREGTVFDACNQSEDP